MRMDDGAVEKKLLKEVEHSFFKRLDSFNVGAHYCHVLKAPVLYTVAEYSKILPRKHKGAIVRTLLIQLLELAVYFSESELAVLNIGRENSKQLLPDTLGLTNIDASTRHPD